jgi:LCP family protein required for cell wall assembly
VRALVGLSASLLVLAVGLVATAFYLQHRLSTQVDRVSGVFAGLGDRPARVSHGEAAKATNILLLGSDRRSKAPTTGSTAEAATWEPGAQRSDTMMVLHIDGDRQGASLVSIPRDSWVDVPGYGSTKINAAFSFGGPSLAVETVERLTGVRIDHLAVIDWDGFRQLTDALGGVTVSVPETVHDSARGVTWTKGVYSLDGEEALTYVRQRYGLPGGDFDRIHRQQYFLRTLMGDTADEVSTGDPRAIYDVLDILSRNLTVDAEWSTGDMRDLAFSLRGLDAGDVDFLTVPLAGLGREGAQSVVYLDRANGATLWRAVRNDRVDTWVAEHPDATLPAQVR